MIFERFKEEDLCHYSYAIGCPLKKQIAIIDPQRDLNHYLDFAASKGCVISHVLETHVHGDYASGAFRLAKRTGAHFSLFEEGKGYKDGDEISIGTLKLKVIHTPGHAPEHLSYYLEGQALFSGDFLLVNSVGRVDLLGPNRFQECARLLYQSVREKLPKIPDGVRVYPAHGSDSFCGVFVQNKNSTTVGQERRVNPFLKSGLTEEGFIDLFENNALPRPEYFSWLREQNRKGWRKPLRVAPALTLEEFQKEQDQGAVIIDLRGQRQFGRGHIPKSFGIGAQGTVGF